MQSACTLQLPSQACMEWAAVITALTPVWSLQLPPRRLLSWTGLRTSARQSCAAPAGTAALASRLRVAPLASLKVQHSQCQVAHWNLCIMEVAPVTRNTEGDILSIPSHTAAIVACVHVLAHHRGSASTRSQQGRLLWLPGSTGSIGNLKVSLLSQMSGLYI